MEDEILDKDLDFDIALRAYNHYTKWAKRWSWISVIILFLFVLISGVLLPIFNNNSKSAVEFFNQAILLVASFLTLLTISNLISLFYRIKGFNALVKKSERDYFNLIIAVVFLLAPVLIIVLYFGL